MMDECVCSKTLCWGQASTAGKGNSRCEESRVRKCLGSLKNRKMISWLEEWSVESGGLWVCRARSPKSLKAILMRTVLSEKELIHSKRDRERERRNFRRWEGMEVRSTSGRSGLPFCKMRRWWDFCPSRSAGFVVGSSYLMTSIFLSRNKVTSRVRT